MIKTQRLFVIWRTPVPERRRHVIGELWKDREGFRFAYRADLKEARAAGFTHLPEFPGSRTASEPYQSGYLFGTFAQRIPSPHRGDRQAMLDAWGVDDSDSPLEILARSGGLLTTDRVELAEYRDDDDDLSVPLELRLAGGRCQTGGGALAPGDVVQLEREPTNEQDACATLVRSAHREKLGYVPRQYAPLVARLLDAGRVITGTAVRPFQSASDEARWVIRLEQ